MRKGRAIPLGSSLSLLAALVFATPTLFLPPDVHVGVKAVFIAAGSVLLAVGVIRVRAEGVEPDASDEAGSDPLTRP